MLPESRGSVRIRSPEAGIHPRIVFNYLSREQDVIAFRRCIELSREILSQPALREVSGEELMPGAGVRSNADVDAWIRQNAQSAYHPCGTCPMGEPGRSVVDGEGRVHGIEGLRVVDASIFPMITNGNLNAPTIMVAEKIVAGMTGSTLPPEPQPYYQAEDWQTCQR
jgi:choline dehydrogenase